MSCHDFVDNQGRLQLFVLAYITDSKARDGLAAMDKLMRQTVTESERPLVDDNLPSSPGRVTAAAV